MRSTKTCSIQKNMSILSLIFITSTTITFAATADLNQLCSVQESFKCANGFDQCININYVCDGVDECTDKSDEDPEMCKNRTCGKNEFKCAHGLGQCIHMNYVCDGDKQCTDNSDENPEICKNRTCALYDFKCTNGLGPCIRYFDVCNGVKQCIDNSDEDPEMCKNRSCGVYEFKCAHGLGQCIHMSNVCDGFKQCTDNSDEDPEMCKNRTCASYEFKCANGLGQCIHKNFVCNGVAQCTDKSDENPEMCKSRTCGTNEFKCADGLGQCIRKTYICDGVAQCTDKSDENFKICKNRTCGKHEFKCSDGQCIHTNYVCDGVKRCTDNSDEDPDMCKSKTNNTTTSILTLNSPSTIEITGNINTKRLCKIPNTEGSLYFYNGTIVTPGKMFENGIDIDEKCTSGYHQVHSNGFLICMKDGNWKQSYSNKLCLRMCPPMISDNLDITCTYNGEKVDCSKQSIPGTTLSPKCKSTHTVTNGIEMPLSIHCQHDGTWNNKLYSCVPKCGLSFVPYQLLILFGNKTIAKSVPWNVAVYKKSNTNNYNLICGGTLITPTLVVSAAHCFWISGLRRNAFTNNGLYKMAVGKNKRNISIIDDSFTQIIDVKLVYMENDYLGSNGHYANDIAIVVLSSPVVMSENVMPICVDWSSNNVVKNGYLGKIAGWGATENSTGSPDLLEASLPYIDVATCRKNYENGFDTYLTKDKFCAGTESGQGIHQGDSGAGLTIEYNGLHFLVGVASIKNPNTNDSVAAFTNVRSHIEWIRKIYIDNTHSTKT